MSRTIADATLACICNLTISLSSRPSCHSAPAGTQSSKDTPELTVQLPMRLGIG